MKNKKELSKYWAKSSRMDFDAAMEQKMHAEIHGRAHQDN
jgi:hypothetical protein